MRRALFLVALAGGVACSTPDAETSVFLEIYDGTVTPGETRVSLDVFDTRSGDKIVTLDRTAALQTSATAPLGSVVILGGATPALGALRIQGQRTKGGSVLSEGSVEVALVAHRQVSARLALAPRGGQPDAGATDSGGDGRADGGRPADAGSPPADVGTPPADSGTPGLANGDSCRSGSACNSGFCTEGLCCDSACDALCHGCNLVGSRGICKGFSAGSECVPATCNVNDNSLTPARACDGNGNCGAARAAHSCGNYRCQIDACLRSCSSSASCISSARCFDYRCN